MYTSPELPLQLDFGKTAKWYLVVHIEIVFFQN